ncbi:unnamed protein product, partial [Staurois parvus]
MKKSISCTQYRRSSSLLEGRPGPAQSEVPQDTRNPMVHLHWVVPDGHWREPGFL